MNRVLILCMLMLLAAASCKKEKNNKAIEVKKKLATYWQLGGTAIDYNGNKNLDDSERIWKTIDEDVHLTLQEDGTASYYARNVSNAVQLKATWALGDSTSLAIYIPGYDSLYYTVDRVTYDELTLINDGDKPKELNWTFFYRGK